MSQTTVGDMGMAVRMYIERCQRRRKHRRGKERGKLLSLGGPLLDLERGRTAC